MFAILFEALLIEIKEKIHHFAGWEGGVGARNRYHLSFGVFACLLYQFLGPAFGRTDFSRIFIFEPPDFFADFLAGFFLLIFVGKSAQKNPPGKSPAKSSKIYTTKILQHISADCHGQQFLAQFEANPCSEANYGAVTFQVVWGLGTPNPPFVLLRPENGLSSSRNTTFYKESGQFSKQAQ